jgi:hypothetical protein
MATMTTRPFISGITLFAVIAGIFMPFSALSQVYYTNDTTPPWVTRWAVTNVTPFAATINWTTDEPADGRVEFCKTWTHCANFTPLVPGLTVEHTINLSGLSPYTRYYFWVYSRDQWGNLREYGYRTFTTSYAQTSPTPAPSFTPAPTATPWPTPFPTTTPVPSPDTTLPWVMKWSVTNILPFSATINWTTDEPTDAKVEFCTTWVNCGNFTPLVPGYTTNHSINLSGLTPGTKYFFWLYSRDAAGNMRVYVYRTFNTAWTLPTPTPTPTPYPSQPPIIYPDTTMPWVMRWTVTNITNSSAQIDWIMDELTDGRVEYCLSWVNCANFTPLNSNYSYNHTALLTGLKPYTRYYFWIHSRDMAGNLRIYGYRTFTTAP